MNTLFCCNSRFVAVVRSVVLLCLCAFSTQAQTTLQPGDMAIIGANRSSGSTTYELAIVSLVDISAATTIYISDYGWSNSSSSFVTATNVTAEGSITWLVTSNIARGTVFLVKITGASSVGNPPTITGLPGTVTGNGWNTLSTSVPVTAGGDNWFIYQGTGPTVPTRFVYGFTNYSLTSLGGPNAWLSNGQLSSSVSTSELPPTLTNGSTARSLSWLTPSGGKHGDFNVYTGTTSGTRTDLLAAIGNVANWATNETSGGYYLTSASAYASAITLGGNPYFTSFNVQAGTPTWNGTTWVNGTPNATTDAIIASSTAPSSFTAKALTINSGVSLNTTGITATINGNINNNGNGITGTGNLIIASNSALQGNPIAMEGTLTVNSGATLTTNDKLTMISTASGTGSIGNSAGAISGSVRVERFIPAKSVRKNIFLSSPVTAQINNAWQQQIHITGSGSGGTICPTLTSNSNGFDVTVTNAPSMFTYNPSAASGSRWRSISNTNATNLMPGNGYRVNVRGSRVSQGCALIDGSGPLVQAVTLSATGTLAQGDVAVTLQQGYNLVGNPYQAPINFNTIATDNSSDIANSYWTYNPANAAGTYSVFNAGTLTNKPGGYTNDNIIAIGQAFFVQKTTTGSATINNFFRESHKSTTAQTGLFRTQHWLGMTRIALRANDDAHIDEAVVRFGNQQGVSNTAEGTYDALNISEGTEGISSLKAGNRYSIQTRRGVTTADTVSLHVVSNNNGSYKLHFSELQIGSNNAILIDKFSNQQQAISEGDSYSFTTTNDPASKGNRFDIVFRSSATLPTHFTAIYAKAKQDNKAADVIWTVGSDKQVVSYTVERSTDGRSYKAVGSVASQQSNQAVSYSYTDQQAITTVVYYRVKATAADGSYKYSAVAKLNGKASSIELSLYPNPVQSQLSVQLSQPVKGQLAARVIDSKGQVVYQQSGINLAGSNLLQLSVAHLPQGTYQLTLTNGSDFTATGSFVK